MRSSNGVGTLDVGLLTDDAGCDAALEAFDGLQIGESLMLRADGPPRGLLRRLQAERRGTFEWSVLQADASAYRVQLTRRDARCGDAREVAEALEWDHDRLDALEQRTFGCLGAGDEAGARAAWAEFSVGLRRHIRFEEELLFPVFEERLGVPAQAGPTAVMRAEHRQIERLIEEIGRALTDRGAALPLRAELHRVLGEHNRKEEGVLYPATDRALRPAERDELVARIQAS